MTSKAGFFRLLWRKRYISSDLRKAYRATTGGERLSVSAMKNDPRLRSWTAMSPLEAKAVFDASDPLFTKTNRRELQLWLQRLTTPKHFEQDFEILNKRQDFELVIIETGSKKEGSVLIEEFHKPLDGVSAYNLKNKVVLIGGHANLVRALQSSNTTVPADCIKIAKGSPVPAQEALATAALTEIKLASLAEKMKCRHLIEELEESAILKRGKLGNDPDFHQYIRLSGEGWQIECAVLQDGLWKIIQDMETEKTGVMNIAALRRQVDTQQPVLLETIDLKASLTKFAERYEKMIAGTIDRLERVIPEILDHFKRKLINIRMMKGQKVVFVGDNHQNLNNLKLIFEKYEPEIKAGKIIMVILGDYIHEAGNYPWSNLHSATQSLETMEYLLEKLEAYPGCIIPKRGNHDIAKSGELRIIKDGVDQGETFLRVARYFDRGQEYLNKLEEFFESLPWASVAHETGGPLTFSAHSIPDTSEGIGKIIEHIIDMLKLAPMPEMRPEDTSTHLISQIMRFVNMTKSGNATLNPDLLITGRKYLLNPELIEQFFTEVTGLANIILGHTFLRERDEKDADCHQFFDQNGRNGYILQSYLGNLRVLELTPDGKLTPVWLQNEDQYWGKHPQYLEG